MICKAARRWLSRVTPSLFVTCSVTQDTFVTNTAAWADHGEKKMAWGCDEEGKEARSEMTV